MIGPPCDETTNSPLAALVSVGVSRGLARFRVRRMAGEISTFRMNGTTGKRSYGTLLFLRVYHCICYEIVIRKTVASRRSASERCVRVYFVDAVFTPGQSGRAGGKLD